MTLLFLASFLLTETIDLSLLLNVAGDGGLFSYANILLTALVPVVLIGLGFALARYVISFVQRIFSSL